MGSNVYGNGIYVVDPPDCLGPSPRYFLHWPGRASTVKLGGNLQSKVESEALALLRERLEQLLAKDDIRDCLYRFCRGIDRIDSGLIRSAFHEDATIDYGLLFNGSVGEFVEQSIAVQKRQVECQHLIGNILIEISGQTAAVESYEIARHVTPMGDQVKDMVLASRTLDIFEKRQDHWAIVHRKKVLDWARFLSADRSMHDRAPITLAQRDESDASYALFAGTLGAKHTSS